MNHDAAVDGDFAGGNIVVERIVEDNVFLRQDLRDTEGHWFYWYFRVRGVQQRTLTFRFTDGDVVGVHGPAVSIDGGTSWRWLGKEGATRQAFSYAFDARTDEVRFSNTIPYLEDDLKDFLKAQENHGHLEISSLCQTKKGREVEKLRLGKLVGDCECRVLLTCRHHACESIASYALEGLMGAVLAATELGSWFQKNVELVVVPFMDKDGVEDGDQGKNRRPHDHNRDYLGGLYPEVRALRRLLSEMGGGPCLALDMHCPYLHGPGHEAIYFVGGPNEQQWRLIELYSETLEKEQRGPLVFDRRHNLPYGQGWNVTSRMEGPSGKELKSCARWVSELPGVLFATSIEIP